VKNLVLFAALAGLGWCAAPAAQAQTPTNCGVNYNPVVGVNCANVRKTTYVGQILGLVPVTGATDVWCVNGSSSRNIIVREAFLSGTATAATLVPVSLIRRNTLDTGGTSTVPNIAPMAAGNPTATATAIQYTANPTITDTTSHQTMRAASMLLGTAAVPNLPVEFKMGTAVDAYDQSAQIVAGATTQQICLNLGAAALAGGQSLYGFVEWTEE